MPRDPRYDVLFEPVTIGPVTAPNRFYQVPHCSGMGSPMPKTLAAMRGIKAEGGWGVVCTELCSIHASSDDQPYPCCTLWDDEDVRAHALMCDAVHAHGSLAGVELWYGGRSTTNLLSREVPFGVESLPCQRHPFQVQTRAMDKADIRELRRWHRDAALRAKRAGFDIVYVYATHGFLLSQFMSRATNRRGDEYGGSLENRVRLVRELIEETKDAVGETCGIAVRFSTDAGEGGPAPIERGEQQDIFAMLAELPDIWDVNINDFTYEAGASRFVEEAWNEPYYDGFKALTTKPLVGVGRFTSPDTMVRQITQGRLDMIGAARPSIADPFLPKKIEEGREDDIRECIGCNTCLVSARLAVPLHCTQNPTMGEEWRRGWHPERIAPKGSDDKLLVVGAGPAGLEAARALGQRGYAVTLAEAADELGGRVTTESALPGLADWARVRDWRIHQMRKMANVEIYPASRLDAVQVRDFGFAHVVVATGSAWRRDGVGRWHSTPVPGHDHARVFTPDDVMAGAEIPGPVVVFDDDHAYMGGLLAETLASRGLEVALVTPVGEASSWTILSDERGRANARLAGLGVTVITNHAVAGFDGEGVELCAVYGGAVTRRPAAALVMVTARIPDDSLYHDLMADEAALTVAGIKSVTRVGDCLAPGTIAAAVHSGHACARALDGPDPGDVPFRRERATV